MKLRIQYMYENGNVSFADSIMTSKNASQLLNRAEYASQIATYDRKMLKEYQATREKINQKELEKPARDPRDEMPKPILRTDVLEMKDLKEGMVLKGTVRNVIDFGVFVDIGVHQDGLVHISQITDRYIKHPLEAVSVGDIVDVKVMSVDLKKKRIQLTMRGI